jgi:DNA-binding GntR family transcriptional regulator
MMMGYEPEEFILSPESAEPLSEVIIERLTKEIITGQLPPGSILDSVSLARRFQTSRTPVREALLVLASQGLTSMEASKRARVTELSLDHIEQLCAVRARLLQLATELAIDNLTDESFELLQAAEDQIVVAIKGQDTYAISIAFSHVCDTIANMSGNEILIKTLATLRLKLLHVINFLSIHNPSYYDILDDHVRLLRAFSERDKALAVALVQSLTAQTVNYVRDSRGKLSAGAHRKRPMPNLDKADSRGVAGAGGN